MNVNGIPGDGTGRSAPPVVPARPALRRAQSTNPQTGEGASAPSPASPQSAPPDAAAVLANLSADNVRAGSRLRVDEATDRVVIQIVNRDNEVIKQIPPDDALKIAARFRDLVGVIFDRQA